jgi:hydroxyacylglutathione hydrolase
MHVHPIPILNDNYAYLLVDEASGAAAVVDPAEPGPVIAAVEAAGVRPTHVLCTHHHPDHSGGNVALRERWPDVEVVGSAADAARIPGLTRGVGDGDVVAVGGLAVRVLFVPCHTRGHLAFLAEDALFCGDTLFVAGCGRFFEGDAAQMHRALQDVFGALPSSTRVFCGHEYTVTNLRFALTVEPDNAAAREKLAWAEGRRAAGLPTVPGTLGEERAYNPFVRAPLLQERLGAPDAIAALAELRRRKDEFRG